MFLPNVMSLNCTSGNDCVQLGGEIAVYCSAAGYCECEEDWVLQGDSCVRGRLDIQSGQSDEIFTCSCGTEQALQD